MNERIATLTIKRLRISDLKPHPRNPRTHPKPGAPAWQVLERSLDKDYFDPLVTNERNGLMVSGHLRLKVMTAMGFTEADVVCVDYDEPLHLARMMAANTLLGEFEETIMASLARDLDIAGIDAALAGLTDKAMMALVECPVTGDDTEQTEELVSKAELLQQKWKVAPGDLYQIGPHRLLCGVCESPDNWQRLLGESQADMIWCDPPYNVAYDRSQKKRVAMKRKEGETPHVTPEVILNDDMPREEYLECLNDWFSMGAARLKPGGAVYIAHAESFGLETRLAARDAGFYIAQCLIWVKQAWTMGRQDYQWQHEPVLYGWKAGAAHHWQGGYSQATVLCDLIPALLAQRGRTPHLRIATLSMSSANAAELARLVALGLVGDITIVCSHYFAQVDKATTFREVAARLAGIATICVCRVHCKVICIPTVTADTYVIEGSANLRSSDNTEQIVITNDPATHQFHASWIDGLVKKHG